MTGLARSLAALSVAALAAAATPPAAGGSGVGAVGGLGPGRPASPGRPMAPVGHCSSVALDNGGVTVFGANLDHVEVDRGLVFVNKRGTVKTGLYPSTTGFHARWVSTYASVTFDLVGFGYAWAGMNERGLAISTMALPATVYPSPDARPPLDSGEWIQYLLDTCATIEDVIATEATVRATTVDHYLVADAFGKVAAVEFLGGQMVVRTGAEMPARALTNSTYDNSVRTWLNYKKAGNSDYSRLDGSLQRFCLAADRADTFRPCDDAAAVSYAFGILERVAGELFSIHASQWSIVFDTSRLRAHYRTLRFREVRFVDLASFDPWCTGPVQMLDIHAGPAGDVAGYFSDYSHDTNLDHMRWFLLAWGVPFTEQTLLGTVQHLESFACQRYRSRRHLRHAP